MTKPTKWHVRPAKTQISLGICPDQSDQSLRWVWSESLLSAWRKLWSLATHWAHSKDWSDCMAHMPFCWFCHEVAQVIFQSFARQIPWGQGYDCVHAPASSTAGPCYVITKTKLASSGAAEFRLAAGANTWIKLSNPSPSYDPTFPQPVITFICWDLSIVFGKTKMPRSILSLPLWSMNLLQHCPYYHTSWWYRKPSLILMDDLLHICIMGVNDFYFWPATNNAGQWISS